jgi:hypothetical protein
MQKDIIFYTCNPYHERLHNSPYHRHRHGIKRMTRSLFELQNFTKGKILNSHVLA